MEIKVFRDTSKKESTIGGLTFSQWFLIITILLFLVADIANSIYLVVPSFVIKIVFFPFLGLVACNALFRPHGMKFITWVKLFIRFQTTVQTRTYQLEKERMKKYEPKDFKKGKAIKETQRS